MSFSRARRVPAPHGVGGNRHHFRPDRDYSDATVTCNNNNYDNLIHNHYKTNKSVAISGAHSYRVLRDAGASASTTAAAVTLPSSHKRKRSAPFACDGEGDSRRYRTNYEIDCTSGYAVSTSSSRRRDQDRGPAGRSDDERGEGVLMSRDEIERCSPSRKDGIDLARETHLRQSYCSYIRSLGTRLQVPQTTIATATVLCHRFFVRRSHASHDRFLIATAALFLAAKSEETPCPLNTVLRVACEICHKPDFAFAPYMHYGDWFEKYRERVVEAETLILTTLDFELSVQHPYVPLSSVLHKLGLSQSVLFSMAWNLVNEGLQSSLWLQFKPQHIAAGATFLASKFLNFDLAPYWGIWQDFQTSPYILREVVEQLMELI